MAKKLLWTLLIVLLLGLQYRLWIGEGSLSYVNHLDKQIEKQEEKNQSLEQRNDRLKARVQEYREGQDILEEQARSQLGMIKDGETFIQIIEDDSEED